MRRIKQYLPIIFIVLIVIDYFVFLFAQEEVIEPYYSQVSKEKECLKKFDINKVDFKKDSKVIKIIPYLAEYFQCRAGVRDNIKECDNLNPWPDRVKTCQAFFNEYHGIYGRLYMEGLVKPSILSNCINNLKFNREDCQSFLQAWIANDTSVCMRQPDIKLRNECEAMINGDRRLCSTNSCRNKASYVKAIKTGNIKDCDEIESSLAKSMCQGYISGDEDICEKNKGFEEFRSKYCQQSREEEYQDAKE